jgi:hypothetical protein
MGKQGSTSGKRQREAEKAAKAKAKRERRQLRATDAGDGSSTGQQPELPPSVVLERLAEAHRRFERDEISFAEYDEVKAELLRQLRVD